MKGKSKENEKKKMKIVLSCGGGSLSDQPPGRGVGGLGGGLTIISPLLIKSRLNNEAAINCQLELLNRRFQF